MFYVVRIPKDSPGSRSHVHVGNPVQRPGFHGMLVRRLLVNMSNRSCLAREYVIRSIFRLVRDLRHSVHGHRCLADAYIR